MGLFPVVFVMQSQGCSGFQEIFRCRVAYSPAGSGDKDNFARQININLSYLLLDRLLEEELLERLELLLLLLEELLLLELLR